MTALEPANRIANSSLALCFTPTKKFQFVRLTQFPSKLKPRKAAIDARKSSGKATWLKSFYPDLLPHRQLRFGLYVDKTGMDKIEFRHRCMALITSSNEASLPVKFKPVYPGGTC